MFVFVWILDWYIFQCRTKEENRPSVVVAIVVGVCVIGTVVPAGVIIGTKPIVVVIGIVGLGVVEASRYILKFNSEMLDYHKTKQVFTCKYILKFFK